MSRGEEAHPVAEEAQRGNDVLSRGVAQKRNTVHVLSLHYTSRGGLINLF